MKSSQWSILHGFYGSMGGFVVEHGDVRSDLADEIFKDTTRLTLTARGAALVAQCQDLPYISREDIKDKNKADTVAKLFVCIQAGWFTVQVFARLASGLPVTLLEVNTLGHIAIALVMYVLWWHKPRQVREPTKLDADWLAPLLAFMFMTSKLSGREHRKMPFHQCADDAEAGFVAFHFRESTRNITKESDGIAFGDELMEPLCGTFALCELEDAQAGDPEQSLAPLRWNLAAEAVMAYPEVRKKLRCMQHGNRTCTLCESFRIPMEELLVATTTDWPTDELLRRVDSLIMGVILWGATIVYGAIHTAAWNAYFPTVIEAWMWHSSSVWVAFSGAVWVFINGVAKMFPHIDSLWIRFLQRKTHWMFNAIVLLLCTICGLAYIFSRAFLVVEAFLSLRKLPASAYETPSWLQILPHL